MPIYEYECLTCGTTFEKRQSFNAEPIADCPNGHNETRRRLSAPTIVFKGSGFYVTDSKSSSNGKNGSSTSKSEKSENTTEKSETKSETKAETKTETKATSSSE
jgi:putative FmdB family regulatory protein